MISFENHLGHRAPNIRNILVPEPIKYSADIDHVLRLTPMKYLMMRPLPVVVGKVHRLESNADSGRELTDEITCSFCGLLKPATDFYFCASRIAYNLRCKTCQAENRKQKRLEIKEKKSNE